MTRALAILPLCILTAAGRLAAAGGEPQRPSPGAPGPQQEAIAHYNEGLAHRDKARDYEQKAAAADSDADREKHLTKARQEYGKAIDAQLAATAKNPRYHEAFSSLGYAYRKTGDLARALAAYDRALALAPDYIEAVEYRGEAYLELNRLDDAKAAYEWLFRRDPVQAASLLQAAGAWVEARRAAPAGVAAEAIAAMGAWVAQKAATAAELSGVKEPPRDW